MAEDAPYRRIADHLRSRIEAGEWEPGGTLPRQVELAKHYQANRDTVGRAIKLLEYEGLVWAVPRRGTIVRHGLMRLRRPRGNLVKRNLSTDSPGYSFPSASGQEKWDHFIPRVSSFEALDDPRLAKFLGVKPGTRVMRRFRLTGPTSEPPFQINISWIHPRGTQDVPQVGEHHEAPGDWLYRLEVAGHWPIAWMEFIRARRPDTWEAGLLEIPQELPVIEIVRQGVSGGDGKPIEVTMYVVASDRVELVQVLDRDPNAVAPWPEFLGE